MNFGKAITASASAIALLLVAGAASAAPLQAGPNAASRLSLAGASGAQFVRATSLQRKKANQEIGTPLIIALVVVAGLGIAAAAGAFSGGSHSP